MHALQRAAACRRSKSVGRPDRDAALDALGEDHALRQRSPELGRDREPVLRVERVVEGAAEGQVRRCGVPCREREVGPRWRSGRSPSTPVRYAAFYPTFPHNATQIAHFLPPMSTVGHRRPTESAKKQAFSRLGRSSGVDGRTCARRRADRRSARVLAALAAASVRRVCLRVGRGWDTRLSTCAAGGPSPTMRGDEDHAPARPDPGARAVRRRSPPAAARSSGERRRRRSRRADPGRRPGLRRGRRAPRRQGPQRPRGRAEEDPAHRRPRREDPAADRRSGKGETGHASRTTSSRGSATASASRSPRCTTAGTPTSPPSSTPRTTTRPRRRSPSRRATSSSAPTRASTTASTARRRPRRRSSTTASWSAPRAA